MSEIVTVCGGLYEDCFCGRVRTFDDAKSKAARLEAMRRRELAGVAGRIAAIAAYEDDADEVWALTHPCSQETCIVRFHWFHGSGGFRDDW